MDALLDVTEIEQVEKALPHVKDSKFLSMGVYPMKISKFERIAAKDGTPMLRVVYDTGFPLLEAAKGNRMLNDVFMLHGQDDKGNNRIEALAEWLKNSLGISEKLSNELLLKQVGKSVAVATKKDKEGFITFWYSSKVENLESMRKNYKEKDESNGKKATGQNGTAPVIREGEIPDDIPLSRYDENGNIR